MLYYLGVFLSLWSMTYVLISDAYHSDLLVSLDVCNVSEHMCTHYRSTLTFIALTAGRVSCRCSVLSAPLYCLLDPC